MLVVGPILWYIFQVHRSVVTTLFVKWLGKTKVKVRNYKWLTTIKRIIERIYIKYRPYALLKGDHYNKNLIRNPNQISAHILAGFDESMTPGFILSIQAINPGLKSEHFMVSSSLI